jgi:hypothetical protein
MYVGMKSRSTSRFTVAHGIPDIKPMYVKKASKWMGPNTRTSHTTFVAMKLTEFTLSFNPFITNVSNPSYHRCPMGPTNPTPKELARATLFQSVLSTTFFSLSTATRPFFTTCRRSISRLIDCAQKSPAAQRTPDVII